MFKAGLIYINNVCRIHKLKISTMLLKEFASQKYIHFSLGDYYESCQTIILVLIICV